MQALRARCVCPGRRAFPTARCCSLRWPRARPKSETCCRPMTSSACWKRSRCSACRSSAATMRCACRGAKAGFRMRPAELSLGNAGTAFRPLTAALALNQGHYRLSGVARMNERPIGDLVDALAGIGADVRYLGKAGFPPLEIFPGTLRPGAPVRVSGTVSSQFLTALLMALPMTGKEQAIEVEGDLISKPLHRDHAQADGAVQRPRAARRLETICDPRGSALREPGYRSSRGRRPPMLRIFSRPGPLGVGRYACWAPGATACRGTFCSWMLWGGWAPRWIWARTGSR
jgi:hypothetical protein